MDYVVDLSVKVIDPNDFVFEIDVGIPESLCDDDIVVDDLELHLGDNSFFVELIFSDEGAGDLEKGVGAVHGSGWVIVK